MRTLKHTLLGFILVLIVLSGTLIWTNGAGSTDIYSSISKNLTLLGQIYKEVSTRYVDSVDPDKFLKAGIDGMLNTLDPYTEYIYENEEQHRLQVITSGKYGGVGILLNYRNNAVTVGEPPFLGTPAARAGIREGDIIIQVNDTPTDKIGYDESARRIRGPAGTEVTLSIRRQGVPEPIVFKLIREQIKVDDVRYAGIIGDSMGYILLTRFSNNAALEVRAAIDSLKKQHIKGLILDLRSNPGGLLDAAVKISSLFHPKNMDIVSTRGRAKGSINLFKSSTEPIYGDGPLVVLVNRFSASASEIVAGAVQDHDRGIILGDTTFGKGLVQSIIPLSPTSALKITTAKYYTPSGRCIQSHSYSAWSDTASLDQAVLYHTDLGRQVHGGGGIAPDVIIDHPPVSDIVIDLLRKSLFFNFAVDYANTHAVPDSNLLIDDNILQSFQQYLKEKSYSYQHPVEGDLTALKKEALEKGYSASLLQDIDRLQKSLEKSKLDMLSGSRQDIRRFLRSEIASKFYGTKRDVEIGLEDDPAVQKALLLLADEDMYSNVLSHNK